MFQGEPFEEEDYCEAIEAIQDSMNQYDPSIIGFRWDDSNPRIQLEPIGARGYIKLRAIVALTQKNAEKTQKFNVFYTAYPLYCIKQ